MTETKRKAFEVANELYNKDVLSSSDYAAIRNGLEEIETMRDRDEELEELWEKYADVPMNPETECIEDTFMGWGAGVHREEIWHWFDRRHSKGIGYLLYRDGVDRTDQFSKMMYLKQFCIECESCACQFNHGGECRFALVHERRPRINDADGCIDYDYQEGEV